MTVSSFEEITTSKPEKSLLEPKKRTGGRNNQGKITARFRGGGNANQYRKIDFKRNKDGVPGKVATVEYDPNRSARIALIHYADGDKRYIICPQGLKVGATIMSGPNAEIRPGNSLPISAIPVGSLIHNVELYPGKGGQLARSAGNSIQLMAKEGKYAQLRLPSGEMRMVLVECRATIGEVGNQDWENISLGKAGRKRWMGKLPHVRGVVMSPRDHPHGGGEAKSPIGRKHPVSPWGQPALGSKTRGKKQSDRMIIRRRK